VCLAAGLAAISGFALLTIIGLVVYVALCVTAPRALVLLFLGSLPFDVYVGSIADQGGFFTGLALAATVAVVVLLHARRQSHEIRSTKRTSRRLSPTQLALFGFLAVGLASALLSASPLLAASRIVYAALFALVGLAIARGLTTGMFTVEKVLTALSIGSAASAVLLAGQFFLQFVARSRFLDILDLMSTWWAGAHATTVTVHDWYLPGPAIYRGIAPFMSPPSAGQYLMAGTVAALVLRSRTIGSTRRLATICAVISGGGVALTVSRLSLLALVVACGVLYLRSHNDVIRRVIVMSLVIVIALIVPIPGTQTNLASELGSTADTSSISTATRLGLLDQGIGLAGDNFFTLGIGPGLYQTVFGNGAASILIYAHNSFIDVAVEMGGAGAVAFTFLLASILLRVRRANGALGVALVLGPMVAALFDDVIYFPRNGILFAVLVAVAMHPWRTLDPSTERVRADPERRRTLSTRQPTTLSAWTR
jgi:hypothetical protein